VACIISGNSPDKAIELSFGVVSGVGPGIHVLDGSPRSSRGRAVSGMVSGIFRKFNRIVYNATNDVLTADRLV